MTDDHYRSPLGTRYASPAMQILWGEPHRIGLWRRLWLALAEAERPALRVPQPERAAGVPEVRAIGPRTRVAVPATGPGVDAPATRDA